MSTHLINEPELVTAAQSGDQNAFGALVESCYRPVFRLAVGIMRNREDAEDVVQDTMLKAYCNLGRFQGKSRFYTWVVRIAINEALMKIRIRQRGKEVSLDEPASEGSTVPREVQDWRNYPEKSYARKEVAEILEGALGALSPCLSAAFCLHNVDELCMKETAAKLGISMQGAKSRISRARSRLRKRLRHILRNPGNKPHKQTPRITHVIRTGSGAGRLATCS